MKKIFPKNNLVKLLKIGDVDAFDSIYNAYCQKLYGFIFKFLKQHEEVEEIIQEVFLKLWTSKDKIDLYASFDAYLFTIAYNATISALRKRQTQQKFMDQLAHTQLLNAATNTINETEYKELNQQIETLIQKLPPRQKEIFLLSRYEGLTHKQIAEKLSISENTVKNQIVTSLKVLKAKLDPNSILPLLFFSLFF